MVVSERDFPGPESEIVLDVSSLAFVVSFRFLYCRRRSKFISMVQDVYTVHQGVCYGGRLGIKNHVPQFNSRSDHSFYNNV